uniref:Uncharacterized protein n=1 Tax=Marseillevirus LCMAC101 TaxID=2506602 RepID=A0A481YTQ6_9VIRU|nr:MAG: uncharacterized protein LCMAC101_04810 [Marseillevirus LCMAC101]
MGKLSLEDAQIWAQAKGGECLSGEYIDSRTRMRWKCRNSHEWETTFSKVKNDGSWCPRCQFDKKMCNLEEAQRLATERGGECLSEKYVDVKSKLRWKCGEGHEWETSLDVVKHNNSWCRKCYDINRRCGLDEAQDAAKKRGGICLSDQYINCREKMEWECSKGHTWFAQYDGIKRGKWCPICGRAKKGHPILTIEVAQEEAKKRGGECLSDTYVNSRTKLIWRCSKGHEWNGLLENIRLQNTWCRKCDVINRSNSIEDAQRLAKKRGGKCLSTEYVNAEKHLKWKCKEGHVWETAYACVRDGKWCPECGSKKLSLQDAIREAKKRDGKCLETEYINGRIPMRWCCKEGHEWKAILESVRLAKSWCPYCPHKSETACRKIFEKLFEDKFPKSRPEFLRRNNGHKLELDGYNEELEIAFEYQGLQHYEYPHPFHKTEKDFKRQQKRDRHKYRLCRENDIALVLVPYQFTHKDPQKMEDFIVDQLVVQGVVGEIVTEWEVVFHSENE